MLLVKVALKILVVSIIASLVVGGCSGGPEEVAPAPQSGSPNPEGKPATVETMPPGSPTLPPGEVPKEQQLPEQ